MLNVIILGLTSLLTDISTEMVYPLIPLFLTSQLGASPTIVGIIEGFAESLASILKVFSGYISDKVGKRKPLAIAGYSFSTIGKMFLYFATSWGWVFLGRTSDRFGKGIRTAPRDALIAEAVDKENIGRAYGLHRALDTLGATIGIALAYYFLTFYRGDYKAVFMYSLIPAFLGVIVLFFAKESTVKHELSKKLSFSWRSLDRRLQMFLIVILIFALGNSSNQFLLLRAKNVGFSESDVILLYLVYNIVYMIFSYPMGRLSDKIGRKKLLIIGYFLYGIVYLGFAVFGFKSAMWILFSVYGLYIALTEGVEKALVAEISPSHLKATVIGLHATFTGIGLLPASFIAGILWDTLGVTAPFYFGGIMGVLAAIGLMIVL
ncbi:major facilitator superfamily MFS_1 [Thermoanaerobacter mathranii subsp. mathranii str. A3]|uniref:Major facilitator superfamily MFS_1 n=1 Tax=Thermoanaerobacter mathranii subsp. mathranii (strain DSM 11426 / CCUG 53645 / CIP 108742 / A3) TaxID=583358 RepID=A0ABM5LQS9_THEM3|nr:MFS transporter [Thermoanaerobacter mathranii]ADH61085.1 major facilitator superfamily MFS_1 [Thermoanaerobacter mathranii subsp. mathranii str. A3]